MDASEVMTSPVQVIAPDDTVAHVRNLMLKHKISRCPVMEDERLSGIITKKDIAYRLRNTEPLWRRRPIDHIAAHVIMTPDPVTISPTTEISAIAQIMVEKDISGLPVLEEDAVQGIVTKSDLLASGIAETLNLTVADLMRPVDTVNRFHSLNHVIDIMSEQNDRVVVVNDNGTLAGIITESNIAFFTYSDDKTGVPEKDVLMLRREEAGGRKWFRFVTEVSSVAEDLMSRPVVTVSSEAPLADAVELMKHHNISSVVASNGNDIRGILLRDDIIKEVAK
jgi:CBS domain-containing protein